MMLIELKQKWRTYYIDKSSNDFSKSAAYLMSIKFITFNIPVIFLISSPVNHVVTCFAYKIFNKSQP